MSNFANSRNKSTRLGYLLPALLVLGCAAPEPEPTSVVILAAASTKDLIREILAAPPPSGASPLPVEFSSGPSQSLAQQVLSGAPADIYISAHKDWAAEVNSAGLAEASVPWLSNELVLVAPRDKGTRDTAIAELSDLLSPRVERVAIAGERVPAGKYAEQALRSLGLWEDLEAQGKIIRGHDVRSTLAYAVRNEVDAAIVYASDARVAANVQVVARFDASTHEPIIYYLVRIRTPRSSPLADRAFQWLQSDQAMSIARKHGFSAPLNRGPGG